MLGNFPYSIDAKGRIFIPSKFREKQGEEFVLIKNVKHKCINVFSPHEWEEYISKLKALPKLKTDDIMRYLCSSAAEVTCDSQGRVVIPQELREFAGLEKEVMIIGIENRGEIWSVENWNAYNESLSEASILAALEELDF